MEQPAQILLPTTKIGWPESIANTLRIDKENRMDHTIEPTIVYLKQTTRSVHSEQKYFPVRILNSGIDISRSGGGIDNRTRMNPPVTIVTTIPESNK